MSDHEHQHEHTHDHQHEHSSIDSKEKLIALLDHMQQHNVSHATELNKILDTVKELGGEKVYEEVSLAIKDYTEGNEKLKKALEILK